MKKENIRKYVIYGVILIAIIIIVMVGMNSKYLLGETQNQTNQIENEIEEKMPEEAPKENPEIEEEPIKVEDTK